MNNFALNNLNQMNMYGSASLIENNVSNENISKSVETCLNCNDPMGILIGTIFLLMFLIMIFIYFRIEQGKENFGRKYK